MVGTDLSERARGAVERAAIVARSSDAKLYIVRAASTLRVGAVRRAARELEADLVVIGARSRRARDALMGSAAERISRRARHPVLFVRQTTTRPYRHALIVVDPRMELGRTVAAARLVAPSAELALLNAYEGPYELPLLLDGAGPGTMERYLAQVRREARRSLEESVGAAGLDPRDLVLRHGSPRRVLEDEERRRAGGDSLLVLVQRRSVVDALVFGGACRWPLVHGTSDVLLV